MTNATVSGGRNLLLILTAAICFTLIPKAGAENYWFERYERAVSLIEAGSHDEAALLLDKLIQEHPAPMASVRIPGDRYIDYLPYYQRARIQLERGDTRAAAHSLDICEAFGAIQQTRLGADGLKELRTQIAQAASARTGRTKPPVATAGVTKP